MYGVPVAKVAPPPLLGGKCERVEVVAALVLVPRQDLLARRQRDAGRHGCPGLPAAGLRNIDRPGQVCSRGVRQMDPIGHTGRRGNLEGDRVRPGRGYVDRISEPLSGGRPADGATAQPTSKTVSNRRRDNDRYAPRVRAMRREQ